MPAVKFAFIRVIAIRPEVGMTDNTARRILAIIRDSDPGRW